MEQFDVYKKAGASKVWLICSVEEMHEQMRKQKTSKRNPDQEHLLTSFARRWFESTKKGSYVNARQMKTLKEIHGLSTTGLNKARQPPSFESMLEYF